MANYIFTEVNGASRIKNPKVTISGVNDDFNGNCSFDVTLSVSPLLSTKSASFVISLDGFTYSGDWTRSEATAWVNNELSKLAE